MSVIRWPTCRHQGNWI